MTTSRLTAESLFGTNIVAMATPMHADGCVDLPGTTALVEHLIATGCDGIVVAGTTGEAPTLSTREITDLVGSVRATASTAARVIAGIGTNDTAAGVDLARAAATAGAHALLVSAPYYSRPTQAGVVAHCVAIADATPLPVMLYDVPARTGTAMESATLVELAGHPRIHAVKDAKGNLFEAMTVMSCTSLAYYCGIDELNLPYLACGATGLVSVIGNVFADRNAQLIAAVHAGYLADAIELQRSVLDLTDAIMRTSQGAIMVKAALMASGIIADAAVRLPLMQSPPADLERLRAALSTVGAVA